MSAQLVFRVEHVSKQFVRPRTRLFVPRRVP